MENNGIKIKATSKNVIAEEAPGAYKDVDSVVRVSDSTGIAKLVCKVKPLAVTKGQSKMIGIIGGSGVYEITSKADNVEKKIVNTDYLMHMVQKPIQLSISQYQIL